MSVCWSERPPAWKEGIETKVENLKNRTAVVALPPIHLEEISVGLSLASSPPIWELEDHFHVWFCLQIGGSVFTDAGKVHRHVRPSADAFLGDIFWQWQCNQRSLRLFTNEEDTLSLQLASESAFSSLSYSTTPGIIGLGQKALH